MSKGKELTTQQELDATASEIQRLNQRRSEIAGAVVALNAEFECIAPNVTMGEQSALRRSRAIRAEIADLETETASVEVVLRSTTARLEELTQTRRKEVREEQRLDALRQIEALEAEASDAMGVFFESAGSAVVAYQRIAAVLGRLRAAQDNEHHRAAMGARSTMEAISAKREALLSDLTDKHGSFEPATWMLLRRGSISLA